MLENFLGYCVYNGLWEGVKLDKKRLRVKKRYNLFEGI